MSVLNLRAHAVLLCAALVVSACSGATTVSDDISAQSRPFFNWLDRLDEGQVTNGFQVDALYLNDGNVPMGGRFTHEHTGFVLDLLQIESVPQSYIWVNSLPESDRGEPHTQEHLLLGKGNVGRYVASLESMSLAGSSAFTQRARTVYHLHVAAGIDAYFNVLEHRLNALLNPDYSDEEIRREVHNYSVTVDEGEGTLRLEEGGTVYNEMVSAFGRPNYRMWRAFCAALYGAEHPLALSSGGLPSGIREMTPEHIRTFHADHYRLGNMGMIGSFSETQQVPQLLERIDAMLVSLQPEPTAADSDFYTLQDLPLPQASDDRAIQFIEYPSQEAQEAVDIEFAWDATLDNLTNQDLLLLSLFLNTLAGDAGTNLYERFIDSATRDLDTGASSVYAGYINWPGTPIYVGLTGIPSGQLDEAVVTDLRERVLGELRLIASWEPGSAELVDFNRRVRSRLTASQRDLRDFVASPPEFGVRGTYADWFEHLDDLSLQGDFRRSLTQRGEQTAIEALLDTGTNFWTEKLTDWGLLSDVVPHAFVGWPSPEEAERVSAEREQRLAAEVERLQEHFGVDDPQEAIARFQAEHDANTAILEEVAAQVTVPPFVDSPPLTLDDTLDFRVAEHGESGVPVVASIFNNVSGASLGISLSLRHVADEDLIYLALLPSLFRTVGVVDGEEAIAYPDMVEALQNEILSLDAWVGSNPTTGRVEFTLRGSGTNEEEARAALRWLELVLFHADWRTGNLQRIRDVTSESLDGLRRMTQRSEEAWVNDPARAYRFQSDPVYLSTKSFMTRLHHIQRLRWRLMEAEPAVSEEFRDYLNTLVSVAEGASREELATALAALSAPDTDPTASISEAAWELVLEAVGDLEATLGDLPDETLEADFEYLCQQMIADLEYSPAQVLADLASLRDRIARVDGARLFTMGSESTLSALGPDVTNILSGLSSEPSAESTTLAGNRLLDDRLREHDSSATAPVFVGLINPDTTGGVFLNSALTASYGSFDEESLLNLLTGRMYGGGGAHSLFMKTWGAGLAYSNGVRADPSNGQLRYYAERCPELPQTMRFVIGEMEGVGEDPELADYALAQVFETRSAGRFDDRAAGIAADLVDGIGPQQVRQFREAVLQLRDQGGLSQRLFERMESVYGQIMPGYGPASADVEGGVFFVIGPEDQLEVYEEYLRSNESPDAILHRLYPRDFWIVPTR